MNAIHRLLLPLSAALLLGACSQGPAGSGAAGTARDVDPDDVAARVAGEPITFEDVDAWVKEDLFRRNTEDGDPLKVWALRRDALERMIDERLLEQAAAEAGSEPNELLAAEAAKRVDVDDEEVRAFYDQNADRIEADFEEIAPQIRRHLESREAASARRDYLAALRDAAAVEVLLDAPRVEVAAVGPARGPEDAPVTIIEFSDYQCPFCKRAEPTVERVLDRYGDRVRFVYRHFPLDSIHPLARGAAEAAACAAEQDRFWDFHEGLFAQDAKLDPEGLEAHAEAVGLDLEPFRTCVSEGRTAEVVEADLAAGREVGVRGTPAFFINGIMLSGARPYEDFVQIIEDELERSAETEQAGEGTGTGAQAG
jgi:protein-disulfide isomerase